MSKFDLGQVLQSFPWDLCRSVYSNPVQQLSYVVSGVSFDWEQLLLSSFIDAKTLIREWLLFKRIFSRSDDVDFSDLQVTPTSESFRRAVLARTVLYQDYGYFDMVAMAYLYMCSVYAEERETLAVFCAFQMEADAALEQKAHTLSADGTSVVVKVDTKAVPQLVFPDWPTLSRWLRCAVEADLQSAPALLAAAALSACQTSRGSGSAGHESFTIEAARRLLQNQLAGQDSAPQSEAPAPASAKRSAAEYAAELPPAKKQAGPHEVAKNITITTQSPSQAVAALQPAPLPAAAAASAPASAMDARRYQQAQQLLQLQAAATVAAYRDNPNQHGTTVRAQALRAGSGAAPTSAGYGQQGAGYSFPAPVMAGSGGRGYPATGPDRYHPAMDMFGGDGGSGVGTGAYAAYAAQQLQQRGGSGVGTQFPSSASAFAAALTQASASLARSSEQRSSSGGADVKSAAGVSGTSANPNSASSQYRGGSNGGLGSVPGPKPLSFSDAYSSAAYAASYGGAPSQQQQQQQQQQQPLPVAQAAQLLQALSGTSSLQQQQQQQQPQQQAQPHAALVNRRQKKNRDKFRVTFQMSAARASELQRLRGIVLNSPPSSPKWAQGAAGEASYSVSVPLKGIDVLANGRYRVQLNTFMNGRKKFSRNSTDLYEALWIFEIALLISDSPSLLSELQRIGNYNCLAPLGYLGFFGSPREYYLELGRHILLFYDTVDFFNEDLITLAIHNYNALKPAVAVMPPGLANQQQPQRTDIVKTEFPGHSHLSSNSTVSTAATTLASHDTSDEDSTGLPAPSLSVALAGAAGRGGFPAGSRYEALAPLGWMAGFESGRSLQDQQLSCLFCLRTLPAPSWLPRIAMVKEDKSPQPSAPAGSTASSGAPPAAAPAVHGLPALAVNVNVPKL